MLALVMVLTLAAWILFARWQGLPCIHHKRRRETHKIRGRGAEVAYVFIT